MANGDGKFGPTWKWIVGILITILLLVSAASLGSMKSDISRLQEVKVDKDQYRCDISRVEGKLDKIIEMQMNKAGGK